ncbi:MFS transporter [Streptomyces sp. NBC_01618]|uniref:MFS transporter n=1 Tax=Streptomyces sp. NBC_01618 TaxID=2975900 RepID=UPI00387005FA|nr:MFS transporter [Streptomyces sp. NBC_01618]
MTGNTLNAEIPRSTFRGVLSLPGHPTWYAAAALIRTPVVMAPLALVFLGHSTQSFSVGAMLAATHALGEAAGAPVMGRRFDHRPFVGQLRLALSAEALAFSALALSAGRAPVPALLALAFVAGAAAAGAPGGMRAQLSATTPEHLRPTALSLESSLSQTAWAIAPPLASLLYVQFSAPGALIAMAVASAAPLLFAHRIPHATSRPETSGEIGDERLRTTAILRLVWPTALLSAAIMFLIGTVDVALPARLEDIGSSPALAGLIMTSFAVASVIAGLLYGSRRWPGTPLSQSLVLLPVLAAAFTLPGLTTQPWIFAAAFAVGGLLYSPLMVIRNLALQQRLPQHAWATGFSVLYAAAGVGYGAAGLMAAAMLDIAGSGTAFVVCTLTTIVIGALSLLGERTHPRHTPQQAAIRGAREPIRAGCE